MKLEIGNFHVQDINFGSETVFSNGLLTINKEEALQVVYEDNHITDADIVIARPNDPIRITPVKEAVEPRCKVSDGVVYPGVTNKLAQAGTGRTHVLKGGGVLAVGKHWGGFQDGLIDMSGPGSYQTMFSYLVNICLVADTDEDDENHEQQKKNTALRHAAMRLAEYLGESVRDMDPDGLEVYDLSTTNQLEDRLNQLPGVVYVMQLQSQMIESGYNSLVYGWDTANMLPTLMHPNELLDGAVVSGSFMPSSSKIATYQHTNNATVKRLMREHGLTVNFLGVIVSNLNVALEEKQRSAQQVKRVASMLGAEGAIVCEEGYGNADTDFMLAISELEDAGIQTIGITNETAGRDGRSESFVDLSVKADALVSTGNVSQLLELGPMEYVVGDLDSLARDGNSGGWEESVKEDGSIVMENNGIFCADSNTGNHFKTVALY